MADQVLFGAAYYPEYVPHRSVAEDLDLMVAAGMNVVRVGESVWSTWEPEEGVFSLDWLQETLDGCWERGIAVILGTPTYAVPMWLAEKHPEIAAVDRTGARVPWGARQEMDFTNADYRRYAERIVRAVVGRYADHPSVIGYQVDNEPGNRLLFNDAVFARFTEHLAATYGSVAALNDAWGTAHWSHRIAKWSEMWRPEGNTHPQYDLAWREFQTTLTTDFINWQAELVRSIAREHGRTDQFVTTCVAYDVPAVDELRVNARLDVAAGNPYVPMQDDLALPAPDVIEDRAWMVAGAWSLINLGDRMWASRQAPFLVTETNAGSLGDSTVNIPGWDGQWRQVAWALVARGATALEYWHWHSLSTGSELTYGGVLPHDDRPGRFYAEASRIGDELKRVSPVLRGFVPDGDVGLVYSVRSKWALAFLPPWLPDGTPYQFHQRVERAYERVVGAWARAVFDAGLSTRILHDRQLSQGEGLSAEQIASAQPTLLASALYSVDDATLEWLVEYVRAGGHLVATIRTGFADELGRVRRRRLPARLADIAGVSYQESSSITGNVPLEISANVRGLGEGATATRWVDFLRVADDSRAVTLATYRHPQFSRYPAVTTTEYGAGRITLIGTQPDPSTASALVDWAARIAPRRTPAGGQSLEARRWGGGDSVRVSSGTNALGHRLHVVHNWSWEPAICHAPNDLIDLLSGREVACGERVALGSWDVGVFRSV